MSHFSGGLLSTSRDCRKVNMGAGECFQQLTRSLTCTSLVQAAARSAESMTGQNLRERETDFELISRESFPEDRSIPSMSEYRYQSVALVGKRRKHGWAEERIIARTFSSVCSDLHFMKTVTPVVCLDSTKSITGLITFLPFSFQHFNWKASSQQMDLILLREAALSANQGSLLWLLIQVYILYTNLYRFASCIICYCNIRI